MSNCSNTDSKTSEAPKLEKASVHTKAEFEAVLKKCGSIKSCRTQPIYKHCWNESVFRVLCFQPWIRPVFGAFLFPLKRAAFTRTSDGLADGPVSWKCSDQEQYRKVPSFRCASNI